KVNLGNYESVAPAYTDWADLRWVANNQTELHIALERMWHSLWANVDNELSRARGAGADPDAFFGLPAVAVEDLTGAGEIAPAVARPVPAGNGSR
ncbi:MAG: hypothetical protein L0346_01000, partial [Chloroflexi bacterium]|nr:hypothetical protein [Chloroflexota bacterium]